MIYLAGPIQDRTWSDKTVWRDYATELLKPLEVSNPLARGYDENNATQIVEGDIAEIQKCSALLVMFDKPSVGTSMEIRIAWANEIPIHLVDISGKSRSPWLIYHVTAFYSTLEEACEAIKG